MSAKRKRPNPAKKSVSRAPAPERERIVRDLQRSFYALMPEMLRSASRALSDSKNGKLAIDLLGRVGVIPPKKA